MARVTATPGEIAWIAATPAELAWLAALPCAILAAAAIALLGPPLGGALLAPGSARFLIPGSRPEPTEHARFVLAALAPFALALTVVVAARRGRVARTSLARVAARASQTLLLACVAFLLVAQRLLTYRSGPGRLYSEHRVYFTGATIAVALAVVAAATVALHRAAVATRLRALARETPARRRAALALAGAFVAIWLLTAFNTEGTLGHADVTVASNAAIWFDETFAILNGAAPLAGFHAQYAQLLPYATAAAMALLGATYGVWAGVMVSATAAAMLAAFATFRRVAGSSLAALALFAPFLATSFFKLHGPLDDRYSPANLFSVFPIRYGGPYVLAWLLARQLGGARPRGAAALGFAGGLVALNNVEFGLPAFAATLAALALTLPRPTPSRLGRLAGAAAGGAGAALLVVALLTLLVGGALPRASLLFEFSRIYGLEGFGMLPMPTVGVHLLIYLTFAAAIVLACVRTVARERDRVLTGLLCWSGVFGLGASGYYVGRSYPDVLIDLFSPWAFALMLLLVASVRAIGARARRWPTPAEVAVLFGFGLAVCSLAQTPTPWSQIERLSDPTPVPLLRLAAAERFVRADTHAGERVMIMAPLGHRIAYDTDVVNAFPYADIASVPAREQWREVLRLLRAQRIRAAFVPTIIPPGALALLRAAGFEPARSDAESQLVELTR